MGVDDKDLLARTARGDADAFAVFFRRHERRITAFAVRRCHHADEVADVVSDTFLVALRRAGQFRAEREDAVPWLYGIAANLLAERRRGGDVRRRLLGRLRGASPRLAPDESAAVDAAIDAERTGDELRGALLAIPAGERAVLELVALDDLTPAEAAQALGLSQNAARLRLSRARRRLRLALGDTTDDLLEPDCA